MAASERGAPSTITDLTGALQMRNPLCTHAQNFAALCAWRDLDLGSAIDSRNFSIGAKNGIGK